MRIWLMKLINTGWYSCRDIFNVTTVEIIRSIKSWNERWSNVLRFPHRMALACGIEIIKCEVHCCRTVIVNADLIIGISTAIIFSKRLTQKQLISLLINCAQILILFNKERTGLALTINKSKGLIIHCLNSTTLSMIVFT